MKFVNLLRKVSYGGQNRIFFKEQRDRITLQNCSIMSKFCYAITFILFCVLVGSFYVPYLHARQPLFIIFFFFFTALAFVMIIVPRYNVNAARRLFFFYLYVIFFFGFIIGVTFDYGYDGIIFTLLTILLPVVFTVSVPTIICILVPIHIAYYLFCIFFISSYEAMVAIIHAGVSLLSSIFIHAVVLSSKVHVLALNEQLRMMCEIDELTQLPNRRSFNHFVASAYASNTNLNIAIADIDNFKDFNDIYGHLFGDDVLKSVAAALGKFADTNSIFVARYGGEEFVLIDNRHTVAEFTKLISDLNKEIYNLNISNSSSPIGRITLSVGIADNSATSCCEEHIEKADRALYKAKGAGKNCIICDSL